LPVAGWPAGRSPPGVAGGRLAGVADDDHLQRVLGQLEGADQGRQSVDIALQLAAERGEYLIAALAVDVVAGEVVEADQNLGEHGVAGRGRVIEGGLGAGDQVVDVVGGEEVATRRRIAVMGLDDGDPGFRMIEVAALAGRLEQKHGGAGQVGVVVEGRRMGGAAGAPSVAETPVDGHRIDNKGKRLAGGV
jgi:hypothetical protein